MSKPLPVSRYDKGCTSGGEGRSEGDVAMRIEHTGLLAILNEIYALEEKERDLCVKDFPVGSVIEYYHGDHLRRAEVVGHAYIGRDLKVTGATGSTYRVDALFCRRVQS
jgi:hypothetical protein